MKMCEQILKKNIAGRIPVATRSVETSQTKTLIAGEAITFCIKPLTHYLRRSVL